MQLILQGNHPDVRIVAPDGLSIKIHQIRAVLHDMSYRPRSDKGFRITILENAEKMTQEAQNSFLKLLEEPPKDVVFIIITKNPESLLPTIRSRCQLIRINAEILGNRNNYSIIVEKICRIHLYSALEVLNEAEAIEKVLTQEGQGKVRTQLEGALITAASWFRDVLIFKETGDVSLLSCGVFQNRNDEIRMLSNIGELYGVPDLIRIIECIEKSRKQIKQNANIRLALEALLFELRDKVGLKS